MATVSPEPTTSNSGHAALFISTYDRRSTWVSSITVRLRSRFYRSAHRLSPRAARRFTATLTYLPTPRLYRLLAFATVSCILPPSPSPLVLMYCASRRKTLPPPQIPPESKCYQEVQYATKNSMSVTAAQNLLICTSHSAMRQRLPLS